MSSSRNGNGCPRPYSWTSESERGLGFGVSPQPGREGQSRLVRWNWSILGLVSAMESRGMRTAGMGGMASRHPVPER